MAVMLNHHRIESVLDLLYRLVPVDVDRWVELTAEDREEVYRCCNRQGLYVEQSPRDHTVRAVADPRD